MNTLFRLIPVKRKSTTMLSSFRRLSSRTFRSKKRSSFQENSSSSIHEVEQLKATIGMYFACIFYGFLGKHISWLLVVFSIVLCGDFSSFFWIVILFGAGKLLGIHGEGCVTFRIAHERSDNKCKYEEFYNN